MDILTDILRGIIGMASMVGIAYLLSSSRKNIDWILVGKGLALQLFLAIIMLKFSYVRDFFEIIVDGFENLLRFTDEGVKFVFGDVWFVQPKIDDITVDSQNKITAVKEYGFPYIFAFRVLPTVIFFSAFSALLFYLGILQKIIFGFAWLMSKTMKLSGAESIAAAANVFIGQTEAPLVIKPYLDKMTKSEIMCLMTGGMATIAGGVFALFISTLPEYAVHFLIASIVSAPAAIVIAKILYPEVNKADINTDLEIPKEKLGVNALDAISKGTTDGVKLAVNVAAMLIVFIAMVALVNSLLVWIGSFTGLNETIAAASNYENLSLEFLLGMLFAPIAWLLGVHGDDITTIGQLLGKKTVVNEVVAYFDMKNILSPETALSIVHNKSEIIATYALCGFANFSSIGIQIGGIGSIAPKQRDTLAKFGIKAMIGGTLACFLTAAIAGMLYSI